MTQVWIDLFGSLGWTLLHSIWQGTLAAILVIGFRFATPSGASALRYIFQALMLAMCLVAFVMTFLFYQFAVVQVSVDPGLNPLLMVGGAGALNAGDTVLTTSGALVSVERLLSLYAPHMGALWCLGFTGLTVHYIRRLYATQKLRTTGLSPVPAGLERQLNALVDRMGLKRTVQLFVSNRVNGPLTLGALKPIILVPASFLTGLDTDEVEAILLHEIAHIHRHDFLVNLIQTAIDAVFFYHPAVRYISRKIDEDRELACDDFAVAATRNPIALARGLATVRLSQNNPGLVLAAAGKDSPLMGRLKRLTGQHVSRNEQGVLAVPLAALTLMAIGFLQFGSANDAQATTRAEAERAVERVERFAAQAIAQRIMIRGREHARRAAEQAELAKSPGQRFRAALSKQLLSDGYIESLTDDFQVKYSTTAMYVDGVKLTAESKEQYCEIMEDAGLKKAVQHHVVSENGGLTFTVHRHGR